MAIQNGFGGLAVTYLARAAYRMVDAVRGKEKRPAPFAPSPKEPEGKWATGNSTGNSMVARDLMARAALLRATLTEQGRTFGELFREAWRTSQLNPMMWVRLARGEQLSGGLSYWGAKGETFNALLVMNEPAPRIDPVSLRNAYYPGSAEDIAAGLAAQKGKGPEEPKA